MITHLLSPSRRTSLSRAVLFGLLTVFSLGALEAPAAAAEARDKERAFYLVKSGTKLATEGKHGLALDAFNEAWKLFQHPKIRFYQARSMLALGRFGDALPLFDALLGDPALKEKQLAEVSQGWAICKEKMAHARVTIHGRSEDGARVDGADVAIDGVRHGKTPLTVTMKRGSYRVRVTREGYQPCDTSLSVSGEGAMESVCRLVALPPAAPEEGLEMPVSDTPDTGTSAASSDWKLRGGPAWGLVGSGAALVVAGLGYYTYYGVMSSKVEEGQEMQGGGAVLGVATGAAILGAGALATSAFVVDWGTLFAMYPMPGDGGMPGIGFAVSSTF